MTSAAPFHLAPPCQPGDRVAIVAPSSPFLFERLQTGCERLQEWGLEPVYDPGILDKWGYLAGDDAQRARLLQQAFADDSIQAILCARGGYGAARLLEHLSWETLRQYPKRFCGFSDITVLHAAMQQKLGWITFHSPMVASALFYEGTLESQERLKQTLFADALSQICPPMTGESLQGGTGTGRLIGGNLALVVSLLGTPYQPDFRDAILVLEDVDEAPYRLDRMFQQLHLSGALSQLAGLGLGDFGGPLRDHYHDGDYDPAEFWLQRLPLPSHCPILYNLPVGHTHENWTLPLGAIATMDADQGTLTLANT